MCVPEWVIGDFGRGGRRGRRVECQPFLCKIDTAMAFCAGVLEEVTELGEELRRS